MSSGLRTRAEAAAKVRSSSRLSASGRSTAAPTLRSPFSWGTWRAVKARIMSSSPTRKMWRDATSPAAAPLDITCTRAALIASRPT